MRLSDPYALRAGGTACVRWRAPWLRWVGREKVGQSPHGRDGHAPFFCAAKSNFKGTMVLFADDFNHLHDQISFERA